jgi:hypothetical protein
MQAHQPRILDPRTFDGSIGRPDRWTRLVSGLWRHSTVDVIPASRIISIQLA